MRAVSKLVSSIKSSSLVLNSAWGITANILQNAFNSAFFVLIARHYASERLAHFLIANTIYQLVAVFSSMGLSSWFIREYSTQTSKRDFTSRYFQLQFFLGLIFYLINALIILALYPDSEIRFIGIALGINIIFDNIINSIKSLNTAKFLQKRTASVLVLDGAFKLIVSAGCVLFHLPITYLALALILSRILTLNAFIIIGSSHTEAIKNFFAGSTSITYAKEVLLKNWRFVIIGSVSVVYWSFANIIISKLLPLAAVAQYEVAFRIFSLAIIIPIIVSSSIYPQFIQLYNSQDRDALQKLYNRAFVIYTAFSITGYSFIVSFSPILIPLIFGAKYQPVVLLVGQMFLTILIFPTTLLQANLIVAMKMEGLDMWFNLISLLIHIVISVVGLSMLKSLSVINYSVLISFLVFHVSQDVVLVRKGITTVYKCTKHYALLGSFTIAYHYLLIATTPYLAFGFSCLALSIILVRTQVANKLTYAK